MPDFGMSFDHIVGCDVGALLGLFDSRGVNAKTISHPRKHIRLVECKPPFYLQSKVKFSDNG